MKKIFLLPLLVFVFSMNVFSQAGTDKATAKADKLSKELGLSAEQKEKVKNFFLEEDKKTVELKAKYGKTSDKSVYHKEAKALRDQTEKNILYVLNATQKTKYESSKGGHEKDKK